MNKYKIIVEYEGTDFVGWQSQENGISIQTSLEKSVKKLCAETVIVYGAGRTDAGVHAKGQVAHFELKKKIPIDVIRDGLNQHLRPLPISIIEAEEVNKEFHARFSATLRTYEYCIINRRSPLTFEKNRAWCIHKDLNYDEMQKASLFFEGKHNFNAFRSVDCQSSSPEKTIKKYLVKKKDNKLKIVVSAKSFLHSQVRIMVGTLVDIGKGKLKADEIKKIIDSKDRSRAGPTAPAHGLYLIKVEY